MNLTKEYFDKALKNLVSKNDLKGLATKRDLEKFVTKADLDSRLERQTAALMTYSDNQVEALARIVQGGFEEIKTMLDVRERVRQLEKDMKKIKDAINV
jgi:hypothetical protein